MGGAIQNQALLDEQALAAAMTYVGLNQVRAYMDDTPEPSEYTSVKKHIQVLKGNRTKKITNIRHFLDKYPTY
ncbi:hypothetical protein TUMSATVNIG1_54770 [Vibrio nigripulchritudo]|nr:hypothetical protein VNTUMSATTG_54380 [Vibrio nigripulchritudo]BDU34868.1 hypothetical protein TUMSATVNIG1_54770 [Vibrio nigripulchritudo]